MENLITFITNEIGVDFSSLSTLFIFKGLNLYDCFLFVIIAAENN